MKSTKFFLLVVFFLASCGTPATIAPAATETFTPEPTATQTLVPTSTVTPAPTQIGGSSGKIIFSYRKDGFAENFPELAGELNLFVANLDGSNITPVTNGLDGFNYLQDISSDGTKILVASNPKYNENSSLYVVDLSNLDAQPVLIAKETPPTNGWTVSAKWIDDSHIVYIAKGDEGLGIYTSSIDGTVPANIYKNTSGLEQGNPVEILAINDSRIYWGGETRIKQGNRSYVTSFAWSTNLDSNETVKIEFDDKQITYSNLGGKHSIAFSPDTNTIAWSEAATPESGPPYHNYLHIAPVSDLNNAYTMEIFAGYPELQWFPDGTKILVFDQQIIRKPKEEYADFFKENPQFESLYGMYEVGASPDLPVKNYDLPVDTMIAIKQITGGYNFQLTDIYDISPDGRQIMFQIYKINDDGSISSKLNILNMETIVFSDTSDSAFSNIAGGVHWIP